MLKTVWHVTPFENKVRIDKTGLRPSRKRRGRIYVFHPRSLAPEVAGDLHALDYPTTRKFALYSLQVNSLLLHRDEEMEELEEEIEYYWIPRDTPIVNLKYHGFLGATGHF